MNQFKLSCLLIVISMFLVGCHTVKGFGRDVEAGGRAIEKAAS